MLRIQATIIISVRRIFLLGSLTQTNMSSAEHRRDHRLDANDSFMAPAGAVHALAVEAGTHDWQSPSSCGLRLWL